MATTKTAPSTSITIPALRLETAVFTVYGTSPIIIHAFAQKARQMMLDKHMGKASQGREKKNPFRDFVDSLYWITDMPTFDFEQPPETLMRQFAECIKAGAKFGFPAIGFKGAMVTACTSLGKTVISKIAARQAFHINEEFIQINGIPQMREDMVRIAMGTADIRFRPEFREWTANIPITFNTAVISRDQIANILNTAGFAVGVGDYRPEKDGQFGRFTISSE